MIVFVRLVFGLGLLLALLFGIGYMQTGKRQYLLNCIWSLLITIGLGVVFFVGMALERLIS